MAKKNSGDIGKESLKAVEDFIKKTEQAKKNVSAIDSAFGNIATQLFGISGAAFFKEVPKTTQEIIKQKEALSSLSQDITTAYEQIGDTVSKKFKSIESSLKDMSNVMSRELSSGFEKVASSVGFDGQIKSMDEIVKLEQKFQEIQKDSTKDWKEYEKSFEQFKKLKSDFVKEEKDYFKNSSSYYKEILADHPDFLKGLNKQERIQALMKIQQKGINGLVTEQSSLLKDIVHHSEGFTDTEKEAVRNAEDLSQQFSSISQEASKTTKQVFSMKDAFSKASKNLTSGLLPRMMEYDQAISDAGKNFGFVDAKSVSTSMSMAALNSEAAKFKMSIGDTMNMMGSLGEELSTIDEQYLANSVSHFVAIQKATGISSEEVTTIAGEMMRAGKSAEDVEMYMEGSNKMAKLFGVNTKKVLQGVARNIDKMRLMGFQGGEESLTRMVATAERLRMNVDEIFDVAKKARTIEGAMDMASELQLAGGSFAAINPMDLLSAARKGPEELQKILTSMGDDIGKFDEKTGEFSFDPVDVDRLQIVADATGQSMDSLQKMIQKNAEDAKKADFMPDLQLGEVMGPDGKPLDQDMMNNMLKDSVDINGKIIEGSMLDEAGISDLASMSSEDAKNAIQEHMLKQKTLAEQAEQNQSLQDSLGAFKDSIMNLFTVFEPLIKILTSFIQTINEMGPIAKGLVAALIGFVMIAPKLGMALQGFKALAGGVKGMFGGAKDMIGGPKTDEASKLNGAASKEQTQKGGGKSGLQSLAQGLKAMGGKGVLKGIANTALAGPALLLLLLGIPTVLLMGAVGAMAPLVVAGFNALAQGISSMGRAKGLMKGVLAMVIIGASLIPFAFALSLFTDVNWGAVGAAALMLVGTVATLMLLGALVSGPGGALLLMGALALVVIGVALMAFGASLMVFAAAAQMMQGLEFDWLGSLGWNLLLAAPGLILGGIALGIAAPFLMFGALGVMAIAAAAMVASSVDWASFAMMGDSLLAIVPGLIGFGFAGLMFLNPFLILGMILMIGTLAGLAMVMVPLAESLQGGADGLDRFADGLSKLQAAASSLDLEKLEMLRNLSWSMAIGAMGGGIMGDAINKIAEALAKLADVGKGGGSGGGGSKKIEINLKLNGRDLQSIIVDDTSIVS